MAGARLNPNASVALRRAEKCLGYETEGGCITRLLQDREGETVLEVCANPPSALILPTPSSAALRAFHCESHPRGSEDEMLERRRLLAGLFSNPLRLRAAALVADLRYRSVL
jgi:hypothetical protein